MSLAWLKARRWCAERKKIGDPLAELIGTELPKPSTPLADTEIVGLDIETTSLDAATADMLSVGWVILRNGRVDLSTAESFIVRPSGGVGVSAAVHGLTDTVVGEGLDWGVAVDKIVRVLTGRVLLVHHAGLDKALLDRLCRLRFGERLLVPVIDTLVLEQRRQRRNHHVEASTSLRLADLRDAYGLPRYAAHDCLVDAVATAELLMAMAAHRDFSGIGDLTS